MYDAIFLSTPSGLFGNTSEAHRCARALYDYIKRFCDKNNICDTNLDIGVSNVNPRKAQYINKARGVGRPQKILVGDLKNCFVRPHLHIIIEGKHISIISKLIISYFDKRYKSIKNKNYSVRIWKEYIFNNEVDTVRKYIRIQSLHYLRLKARLNTEKTINKGNKKRIINARAKNHISTPKNTVLQDNYNQNQIILYNLRFQWYVVQYLKNNAIDYNLRKALIILQSKIEMFGNMINLNVDVASCYYDEIASIAIELENLRKNVVLQNQRQTNS